VSLMFTSRTHLSQVPRVYQRCENWPLHLDAVPTIVARGVQ